ncbi:hypothetical protein ABTW76_03975 [Paenibacillus dendritiformis]
MLFKRSDKHKTALKIGEKTVYPRKITPALLRELFDSIQMIPQLFFTVLTAPASERAGFFVVALRESFDDVVRVTSLLTGIDEEYIEHNASIDELVTFYKATVEVNNFPELLKNGPSVLGKILSSLMAEAQDAT